MMKNRILTGVSLLSAMVLSGCIEGTTGYVDSPNTVIATAMDAGRDTGTLEQQRAAIAYDPDGCQNWIIDDGLEGYASRRRDPVSGLPVCNHNFPAGAVVGNYQSGSEGITDRVPGSRLVRRTNGN